MWLLSEGYKRNPDLQSYLLSWGVPRWVGNGSYFSAENIAYQVGYAKCVQQTIGGSNPHFIGIWNERSWGSVEYVVSLRDALDAAGLASTKIIVPDGGDCGGVTRAAAGNASYASAVYAYGAHYPCKNACPAAAETGLKFWASEDYSTVADWAGAGCWGRSLNQNWVILNSTATISWSTIWSVYSDDSYFGNGLMYAYTPWSGNYVVNDAIWTSAHWTQFISPGWHLLMGGSRGMLPGGGSYVSARSPDGKDFALVLESMQGNCLRCSGGATQAQTLTFALTNGLPAPGTALKAWLTVKGNSFQPQPDVSVAADGSITVDLPADGMLTVSTIATASHGAFPDAPIPPAAPFPLPYADSFDEADNAYDALARYFGDQGGSFAVRHGVLQQVVPADPGPNGWGGNRDPYSLIGDASMADMTVSVSVAFNASFPDRGDGAPPAPAPAPVSAFGGDNPSATVKACNASSPYQRFAFGAVAPGYLSTVAPAAQLCLDLPGCDPSQPLDFYECVTDGCQCGCPGFQNLQYRLQGTRLTTPIDAGGCVTAAAGGGSLRMAACTDDAGQQWAYDAATHLLSVTNPPGGGAALCLEAGAPPPPPPPPPPAIPYALLSVRVGGYDGGNAYMGYSFSVYADASFRVLSGRDVMLGNGTVPGSPFDSSAWHSLSLAAKGGALAASVDGAQVWAGATDGKFASGQVGIGSGYHFAAFDDFSLTSP
jgi:hypothetical protein